MTYKLKYGVILGMKAAMRLEDRILTHVQRLLAERSITAVVSPADELRAVGLTSLDMVNLMLSVEAEFDLMIPVEDITPANFQSITAISRLIAKLLHA